MKENERESAVDIHSKLLVLGLVSFSWPWIPQKAKYNHFRNWGELKGLILDLNFSACQIQVINSGILSFSLLNFLKNLSHTGITLEGRDLCRKNTCIFPQLMNPQREGE